MRTRIGLLLIGTLSLFHGACSTVTVSEPIGTEIPDLQELEIAGQWKNPDGGEIRIAVADAALGIVEISAEEKDEDGNAKLEKLTGHLRKTDKWLFFSFRDDEEKDEKTEESEAKGRRYVWGRLRVDDDMMLFWLPDVGKFQKLVEAQTLPGTVRKVKPKKSDSIRSTSIEVRLGKLTPAHLKAIVEETHGVLFEWDSPLVVTRVK